jgi:hypothetical protein
VQSTSTSISNARGSSSPLISGLPAAVSLAENIVKNFPSLMETVLAEIKAEEEEALRSSMQNHPDWSQHTDKAQVGFSEGAIVYSADGDGIEDLEYGNPISNIAPTGLIRSTAQQRSYDVAVNMSRKFSNKMSNLK